MDAVVFGDTPMANYLEGQGDAGHHFQPPASSCSSPESSPSYAPRGLARLHRMLPPPLKLGAQCRKPGQEVSGSQAAVREPSKSSEDEQFLEHFRYSIVASQLLSNHIPTAPKRRSSPPQPETLEEPERCNGSPGKPAVSPRGAAMAALSPMLLAFVSRGVFRRVFPQSGRDAMPWPAWIQAPLLFVTLLAAMTLYSRWKFAKGIRHATMRNLEGMITSSRALDTEVAAAINFVQEVEIVSRGYELTTPLPPISRLEERFQQRRCMKLRRELTSCLSELCQQYIEAHRALQPFAPEETVEQYHDIYDISRRDFQEVGLLSPVAVPDDQESLRSLKALFSRQFVSRKVVLCDLLAFSANRDDLDQQRWDIAIEETGRLAQCMSTVTSQIEALLQMEQGTDIAELQAALQQGNKVDATALTPTKHPIAAATETDAYNAQLGRLNSLAQGIRTLNAKMHLFKEQASEVIEERSSNEISAILAHQFESVGADIRSLLSEWDRGKQLIILQADQPGKRLSGGRLSRSPMSPTHSIGGSTAVEGSPSDALKRLNGEHSDTDRTHSGASSDCADEEVFEAIALPMNPRSTLTREEKLAKMKEDRLKRALFQERQEANTNMLRELETVIKHRPRGRESLNRNVTA